MDTAITWILLSHGQRYHIDTAITWTLVSPLSHGHYSHVDTTITWTLHSRRHCSHTYNVITWTLQSRGHYYRMDTTIMWTLLSYGHYSYVDTTITWTLLSHAQLSRKMRRGWLLRLLAVCTYYCTSTCTHTTYACSGCAAHEPHCRHLRDARGADSRVGMEVCVMCARHVATRWHCGTVAGYARLSLTMRTT